MKYLHFLITSLSLRGVFPKFNMEKLLTIIFFTTFCNFWKNILLTFVDKKNPQKSAKIRFFLRA